MQAYRKAARKAPAVLCVTLSSKLSTLYDAALNAREMAKTELPETAIEVLDSTQAATSEGMVTLAAARAAAEGKDLNEVKQAAEAVLKKVHAIIFLDTIRHVYRSGRIPKIASQLGSVINIKPILTISGVVRFSGMAHSRKSGIERMLHMMRDKVHNQPVRVAITHAYAQDAAEKLKERISKEFDCTEIWLSEFSPVIGYACGTGTLGISFYPEARGD